MRRRSRPSSAATCSRRASSNCSKRPQPGAGGEIQLTDGIKALLKEEKVFGYTFEGKRFDAGDKFGMLQATVEFALKRPEFGAKFREYLKRLALAESAAGA